MQVFRRVVETGSFVKAAQTLGMAPSSVTGVVKTLEEHLGVRLLQRTTRRLSLTSGGEDYYLRSGEILRLVDESETGLDGAPNAPSGRLRVDMPGSIARTLVVPRLREFSQAYPGIQLAIGTNDRPVDLVQEGIDCVIRTGELRDSTLVARRLGSLDWITCGAPSYLAAHGTPRRIVDLPRHVAIHYFSSAGRGDVFRFRIDGKAHNLSMPGNLAVNDTETYIGCALQGFGLVQLGRQIVAPYLARGELVEVLGKHRPKPVPVSLLYPHRNHTPPSLQAFTAWISDLLQHS